MMTNLHTYSYPEVFLLGLIPQMTFSIFLFSSWNSYHYYSSYLWGTANYLGQFVPRVVSNSGQTPQVPSPSAIAASASVALTQRVWQKSFCGAEDSPCSGKMKQIGIRFFPPALVSPSNWHSSVHFLSFLRCLPLPLVTDDPSRPGEEWTAATADNKTHRTTAMVEVEVEDARFIFAILLAPRKKIRMMDDAKSTYLMW